MCVCVCPHMFVTLSVNVYATRMCESLGSSVVHVQMRTICMYNIIHSDKQPLSGDL